ncbi:MAG: CFI-box-CTERM domain-containing protein [Candidatus Korarchaeum sp.]
MSLLVALSLTLAIIPLMGAIAQSDFWVSMSPERLEVLPGEVASFDITLTISGNVSGSFKFEVTGVPPYTFYELRASTGKFQLKIYTSQETPSGEYVVKVFVSLGENRKVAEVKLVVKEGSLEPDFEVRLSPSSLKVFPGDVASFSISVVPYGGFSERISLSVSGLPPYSYYKLEGVGSEVVLKVITSSSTPIGQYNLTVEGSGGGKVRRANALLIVGGPAAPAQEGKLSVSLMPSLLELEQGGRGTVTLRVYREGEFKQPVVLLISGLPEGSYASADINNTLPNFVSLIGITVGNETPPGDYRIILNVVGGSLRIEKEFTLRIIPKPTQTIPMRDETQVRTEVKPSETTASLSGEEAPKDFSLEVLPVSISIQRGGRGSVAVTLKRVSGNLKEVSLSAVGPEDLSIGFHPRDRLKPGETTSLMVEARGGPGVYTVVIEGRGDGLVRSTTLTVRVEEGGSRCFIATASFGEGSEALERLRDFRDRFVMSTYSGSRFLYAFNSFYYLWSPWVAEVIRQNPALASTVRYSLLPLLGALEVGRLSFKHSPLGEELSIVISGVLVSLMLGSIYLTPVGLLIGARRRRSSLRSALLCFISGFSGTILGSSVLWDELVMISTSLLVVSALIIPALSLPSLLRAALIRPSCSGAVSSPRIPSSRTSSAPRSW